MQVGFAMGPAYATRLRSVSPGSFAFVATWDTDWVSGVVEMSEGMDEKDATVGNVWTKDVRPPEFTLGIVYLSNVSYRGSRRVQVEPKGSCTE